MFPIMYQNAQDIRQLKSLLLGLENAVAMLWTALNGIDPAASPKVVSGSGSPEGVVTATTPTIYLDIADPNAPVIYWKTSGSGNTGWVS